MRAWLAGMALLLALQGALAAPPKVLRYVIPAAETGFDPATARDLYSAHILQAVFDTLYTYDYLARPAALRPQAAAALPEIAADGRTYTIRLKHGILFTPDPAFGGRRRELSAADFVYSWKRLSDPRLASPHSWLFDGKIERFEVVDPYTLRIRLTHTDFNFGMVLAHEGTSAVAREVVERYGDAKGEVAGHPVGSGYYMLTDWVRGNRIVLTRNPWHLPEVWDFQPSADPDDQRIVAQMRGKAIPQIDRIEVAVMVEDQSRWLSFQSGETDLFWLDGPLAPKALVNGQLRPELARRGVQLSRQIDPETTWYYWNMEDPVLGGFSKERIALRRAIAMAHNVDEEIALVWNGQAQRLDYPIPPGVVGHDPNWRSINQYDPALANQLLDRYGYRKGRDGWRTTPDGKPLVIHYVSRAESNGVLQAEVWRKTYNALGIHMENERMIFADLLAAEKQCKVATRNGQWLADYPDGDNFMQLYYGPNTHQNNFGCYADPEYDRLYQASQQLPPGPQRAALYHKMTRRLEAMGAIKMGYARWRNMLAQPSVLGYKKHPILKQEWAWIDVDQSRLSK